ncbi:nucleotidyl transferase AbiEii/AbiGii toxin family protein, partial [Mobiluncus curtisii]|nr:nucleotidyl transferase AbiEii/AbiGii toxin family protein [Mobiluncus curtisii]MCV0021798.1 nucleotidyl transferase AbiEii/AbiGii toxin family protein [Mobiluncus curtisii]
DASVELAGRLFNLVYAGFADGMTWNPVTCEWE